MTYLHDRPCLYVSRVYCLALRKIRLVHYVFVHVDLASHERVVYSIRGVEKNTRSCLCCLLLFSQPLVGWVLAIQAEIARQNACAQSKSAAGKSSVLVVKVDPGDKKRKNRLDAIISCFV
jgi:hypothetical protein